MPASTDERDRLTKLALAASEAERDGEVESALSPAFLVRMVAGFIAMRDRVAELETRVAALENPNP